MRAALVALVIVGCGGPAPTAPRDVVRAEAPVVGAMRAQADDAQAVREMVAGLPEIGRIEGGTAVVVRGVIAKRDRARLVALARAVHDDVGRRFVRGDAHPVVELCLATSDDEYRRLGAAFADLPSELGFYRGDLRVALVNLGRGEGNLRHELVHPLIGDDFPGIPDWMDEGIAALYGTARQRGGRFEFLVNYRLRHLRQAIAAGTLPTRDELAVAGRDQMYGPAAGTWYATARYAMLYLDRKGRLGDFYRAARDGDDLPALVAREIDWDELVRWTRRLKIGRPAPAP